MPVTISKFDMAFFVAEMPDELLGYWVTALSCSSRQLFSACFGTS